MTMTRAERMRNLLSAAQDHEEAGQYDQARQRLLLALRYATVREKTAIRARLAALPARRFGGA